MSWRYTPATVTPRLEHVDGTTPPRPLEAGDYVIEANGVIRYVVAAAPAVLMLENTAGRRRIAHRAPTEGDFSNTLTEVRK